MLFGKYCTANDEGKQVAATDFRGFLHKQYRMDEQGEISTLKDEVMPWLKPERESVNKSPEY